jgi:uncharacterized protein YqgC (DUF456 family)
MIVALSIVMVLLGAILLLVGFIGCIVPVIPGPILGYIALILISIPGGWSVLPVWLLILLAAAAIASAILDNVLPALGSKKAGAGKGGVWGSVIGMIAGSFLTPIGTIVGALLGALIGEILFHPENEKPLKAALGVFKGTMLGILVKLVVVGIIGFYFVRGSIRLFT